VELAEGTLEEDLHGVKVVMKSLGVLQEDAQVSNRWRSKITGN